MKPGSDMRRERLATALRENLKRRKAKGRSARPKATQADAPPPPESRREDAPKPG